MSAKPTRSDECTALDYQPIPESWVRHGGDDRLREDDRLYHAALVAHDPVAHQLVVLYVERFGRGALTQRFDAHPTPDGGVVPEIVYQMGAMAFAVSISRDPAREHCDVSDAAWDAVVERFETVDDAQRKGGR